MSLSRKCERCGADNNAVRLSESCRGIQGQPHRFSPPASRPAETGTMEIERVTRERAYSLEKINEENTMDQ